MKPKYIDVNSLVIAYSGHTPDDDFTAGVNYVLNLLEEKYGEAVQPKEYGKWIFDDPLRGDFICSKCLGRQIVCSRYCPDCGAEMKEGE